EGGLPDGDEMAALIAEARGVIEAPELSEVMNPAPDAAILREVRLTATVPGIGPLHGTVDRLILREREVLAIDYKSNAVVPDRPEATPDGILRQMAAYRAALRLIYPEHAVRTAILWTATRSLMALPDPLLDEVIEPLDRETSRP